MSASGPADGALAADGAPGHVQRAAPLRWLVLGLGRAGTARVRDLQASPDHHLVAALGARSDQAALQAAIGDPDIDAVAVCTDNASHPAWVEAALAAGHHVLCEFPLAPTAEGCAALLADAARRQRVLHVEAIGLLTDAQRALLAVRRDIATLDCAFAGDCYRWVADEVRAGHLGQLAIGRLLALWQLVGPLTLVDVRCQVALAPPPGGSTASDVAKGVDVAAQDDQAPSFQLHAELHGAAGQKVTLREARGPGVARESSLRASDVDGRELGFRAAHRSGPGLFAADLAAFAERVASGDRRGRYVADADLIAVTALAEAISVAARQAAAEPRPPPP